MFKLSFPGGFSHCIVGRIYCWRIYLLFIPLYRTEERVKNWNFTSDLIFTGNGMINKRIFLTKNIGEKLGY